MSCVFNLLLPSVIIILASGTLMKDRLKDSAQEGDLTGGAQRLPGQQAQAASASVGSAAFHSGAQRETNEQWVVQPG